MRCPYSKVLRYKHGVKHAISNRFLTISKKMTKITEANGQNDSPRLDKQIQHWPIYYIYYSLRLEIGRHLLLAISSTNTVLPRPAGSTY